MYLTKGSGHGNDTVVTDGDLVRGNILNLDIKEDAMVIIIKEQVR